MTVLFPKAGVKVGILSSLPPRVREVGIITHCQRVGKRRLTLVRKCATQKVVEKEQTKSSSYIQSSLLSAGVSPSAVCTTGGASEEFK